MPIVDFLRSNWRLMAVLAAINVLLWMLFELRHSPTLTMGELWAARGALGSIILLADTLVVVWWYAELTHGLLTTAREQRSASQQPCVVIEWKFIPSPRPGGPPGWEYVASNVGPGIAINVVFLDEGASAPFDRVYLGALGPGGERQLPDRLQQRINSDDGQMHRYRLLAEPLVGREWCRSDNVCEHSRQMSHRVVFFEPSQELRDSVRTLSLDDLSEQEWARIQAGRTENK